MTDLRRDDHQACRAREARPRRARVAAVVAAEPSDARSGLVSATRQAARASLAAVGAVFAGALVWAIAVLVGISADVIGVVFYRPEDYPYASAWVLGSTLVAGTACGAVLWATRPGRKVDRLSR